MNHRVGRYVFGLAVGLAVAVLAYQWINDPGPRAQRALEERAVQTARATLHAVVGHDDLAIVDPLAPNRKVGKVYVYAEPPGWAVSGFYRRGEGDRWHPFLLTMDSGFEARSLKVQDAALSGKSDAWPILEVVPRSRPD